MVSGAEESATLDSQANLETAYKQRLLKDIERTEEFLRQANSAIEKLKASRPPSQDTKELQLKKDIIARYESYSRLTYFPDKNDVIGVATATTLTEKQLHEQQSAIKHYTQKAVDGQGVNDNLEVIVDDYKQISKIIDSQVELEESKAESLDSQIRALEIRSQNAAAASQDEDSTAQSELIRSKLSDIEAKLHEARSINSKYEGYLRYILHEYSTKQSTSLKASKLADLIHMFFVARLTSGKKDVHVDGFGNTEDGGWVIIESGEDAEEFVKLLLINDLVVSKQLSETNVAYKLRGFGA